MNKVSIVVGSKYQDIFQQCRASVDSLLSGYSHKFVVVDDPENWQYPGWDVLQAPMPFRVMAELVNMGAAASNPDDMLWIQDDVTVISANLVQRLRMVAYSQLEPSLVSPVINGGVGNPIQSAGKIHERDIFFSEQGLAFMCIYFRRDILKALGPMDERFCGYAPDDADYCRRARNAGYNLLVAREVAVRHGFGNETWACTFRRAYGLAAFDTAAEQLRIYHEKWGDV